VEGPAQPAHDRGAFRDEIFAVVNEELDVAGGPVELRGGQIGLLEGSSGDRERVNGVGFAVVMRLFTGVGRYLRGHALAGVEELTFQALSRDVSAVLDCPESVVGDRLGPGNQGEFPGAVVNGNRMGSLVRVDAQDRHW
jgi:hypothetical protein